MPMSEPVGNGEAASSETVAGDAPAPEDDAVRAPDTEAAARPSKLDLLPSPLFVLLLGVTGLAGWLSWTQAEVQWTGDDSIAYAPLVLIVGGWIVSLAVHEYAHALVAYHSGDRALRGSGYLRLNPATYRELFANLVLPVVFLLLGRFGLTGPAVYLDREAVPSRARRSLAALAGPAASLVLAAVLGVVISVLIPPDAVTDNWALGGIMFLCFLNATAGLLNLLPLPGLDGFAAVAPYLPRRFAWQSHTAGLFGVIAVFAVLWLPPVRPYLNDVMYALFTLVGLPQLDIGHGSFMLQLW